MPVAFPAIATNQYALYIYKCPVEEEEIQS